MPLTNDEFDRIKQAAYDCYNAWDRDAYLKEHIGFLAELSPVGLCAYAGRLLGEGCDEQARFVVAYARSLGKDGDRPDPDPKAFLAEYGRNSDDEAGPGLYGELWLDGVPARKGPAQASHRWEAQARAFRRD